jgi:Ca2+-transporting ATPase
VHVPTAGMAFLPLVFGWPLLLFPVHVVFLEFVIDPACSIVFEAEPSEAGAMERPPRPPGEALFNLRMVWMSLLLGATALLATILGYAWMVHAGRSAGEARAFGFAAIVFANLAMILANRSRDRTVLATLARPNRALWWVVAGTLSALAAAIYVPIAAQVFGFSALRPGDALAAVVAGVAGVLWYDLIKLARAPHRAA